MHLAWVSFPFSIFSRNALFFVSSETSEKPLPCLSEEPSSGFGYPLDGVSSFLALEIFKFPTLLGFSLQSFVPPE